MTSSAVYPNIRSAPRFQLVMIPSSVLLIMASSDETTSSAEKAADLLRLFSLGYVLRDTGHSQNDARGQYRVPGASGHPALLTSSELYAKLDVVVRPRCKRLLKGYICLLAIMSRHVLLDLCSRNR